MHMVNNIKVVYVFLHHTVMYEWHYIVIHVPLFRIINLSKSNEIDVTISNLYKSYIFKRQMRRVNNITYNMQYLIFIRIISVWSKGIYWYTLIIRYRMVNTNFWQPYTIQILQRLLLKIVIKNNIIVI